MTAKTEERPGQNDLGPYIRCPQCSWLVLPDQRHFLPCEQGQEPVLCAPTVILDERGRGAYVDPAYRLSDEAYAEWLARLQEGRQLPKDEP